MAEIQYLEINDITRMINVPVNLLLGVREDKDVKKLYFKCKKIVEENVDLSKHQIYVKYINALDKSGKRFDITDPKICLCGDVTIQGDYITFSWLMSESVFAKEGFIAFSVLASDGENTRWNTYPAIGTVLNSVPGGMQEVAGKYPDIITQLLNRMSEVEKIATKEAMQEYVNTYLTAHPGEIDETLTDSKKAAPADVVGQLKEDTNKLIDNTKIAYGKNRCPTKFFDGYLNDKGVLISYSDWKTTDFIYVEDLENVIFSAEESGSRKKATMFFLTTYDSSKNIISYVKTNPPTYAVEDNVCYIRFAFHSKLHKDLMVESGITASDQFEEYTITYEFLNPSYVTYDSIQKLIEVTNNIEYIFGKNRYNPNGDEDGYLLDTSKLKAYSDWRTTSFIDVRGLKEVTASCTYGAETTRKAHNMFFLCIYDENKKFIRQIGNVTSFPYAIPDNVAYLRYSYHASKDNNIMVESGSNISTYEPYEVQMRFIKSPYNNMLTWRNKKWLCLGDSLTEVNIRTTKHYHDYIAEATGISVLNFGSSGTGYKRTEDENKAFYQRIASMPTDVDVVTIFGSGNDLGGGYDLGNPTDIETDTICGCINKTIDTIIGIKPNVSLGIIAPTPWVSYPPNISNNAMANYVNALKTICENRSIPFLDLYHSSNLRPWTEEGRNACYTKDEGNGVHPDETGHKLIAPRFKAFLETLLM